MSKPIIYLDFDDTIANSSKCICDLYNEDYKNHPEFVKANWKLETKWDFITQCPLAKGADIQDYFCDKRFFERIELMDGAKEAIKRLSEIYTIKVISLGRNINLLRKEQYIHAHLDGVSEFIGCDIDKMNDKSTFDLSNGILVDDNAKNLITSNAKYKIAFGRVTDWNKDWQGVRTANWDTLEAYLKYLYHSSKN